MVRSKQRVKRRRFHGSRFTNNTKQNVTENKVVTQQAVSSSVRKQKKSDIVVLTLCNLIMTVISS